MDQLNVLMKQPKVRGRVRLERLKLLDLLFKFEDLYPAVDLQLQAHAVSEGVLDIHCELVGELVA